MYILSLCFLCLAASKDISGTSYLKDIKYYEIVEPLHVGHHARNKRDLSTKSYMGGHFDATAFEVYAHGRYFHMNLLKNDILLPNSYVNILQRLDGSEYITNGEVENCYYHGSLVNRTDSMISISTCGGGLSGLIHDDDGEVFYIEPHADDERKHIIYNMKDLQLKKGVCGAQKLAASDVRIPHHQKRSRRATSDKKYIEAIVVMDNRKFQSLGLEKTRSRALQIMNNVDAVYKTLNTRVAVVGVVVWNIIDNIHITSSASSTLNAFKSYYTDVLLGSLNLYCDNALLITAVDFEGSVVGLAPIGVMCGYGSAAVNQDHGNPGSTANTVSHEMGHNTGMFHNTDVCKCSNPPCVMNAYTAYKPAKGFTDCSTKVFNKRADEGDMPCIYDYPEKLFDKPKCQNGFHEQGEGCDCGTIQECKASGADRCCNADTCQLHAHAECATGFCCDKHLCQFKVAGTKCRSKFNTDCDLEEFCTGKNSECPKNMYINDGTLCEKKKSYCYEGACKSLTIQCQEFWGENATVAADDCFNSNAKVVNQYSNCGKDDRGLYRACAKENVKCGKLQCSAKSKNHTLPRFPIIGSGKGTQISGKCRMGYTSLGPGLEDPSLVLDGSKCREDALCLNKVCTNLSKVVSVKSCKMKCLNGGVCNNNGNCHCPPGFACPNCELAGPGGSFDSGQGCIIHEPQDCISPLAKGLLVLFFLVIPVLSFLAFVLYRYRDEIRARWNGPTSHQESSRKLRSSTIEESVVKVNPVIVHPPHIENIETTAPKPSPNPKRAAPLAPYRIPPMRPPIAPRKPPPY